MKQDKLAELVDDYGRLAESELTLADLASYVRSKGVTADEDELSDAALMSDYLFETDLLEGSFVPRRTFFKGAQFRITPLEMEVSGGFVVPGHRFFPFASRDVFPADVRLILPDGSDLLTRKVTLLQAKAMPFLHFYGASNSLKYLVIDHQNNETKIVPPFYGDVDLTVFDLSDYFAATGFRPGDSLMLTVVDWLEGIYSVERAEASGDRADVTLAQKWVASMKRAFDDALGELETDGDCYEQLALAMRNAQTDPECIPLMKAPPLSLAAYFNLRKDLTVKMVGDQGLFWDVDEDPAAEALFDALENPSLPESELDGYFQNLGLSISEGEVEAYMRDALFQGSDGTSDSVLARVATGRSLFFASAASQEEFHDLWSVLWDEIRQDYSREADLFGDIRARFLALSDKGFATIRELDAGEMGIEVIGNPVFMEFSQLTAMISSMLIMLNSPGTAEANPPDGLEIIVEEMDATIDDLSTLLLQGASKRLVPSPATNSAAIYQLKVSLKGAKPPIWRRLLVSADMELEEFHYAIQAAMGWENCHLYQFKQGQIYYQPNPDDDFKGVGGVEIEDTRQMYIGDLLRKEKQKIAYEYDFGDSWDHEIVLEKIVEPEEGQVYPVCIKGKRACPPEDCGGIWGYYNLLEILDDSQCEEHKQMLEWVGGMIDPEAFDLEEAHVRMGQLFN